MPNSAAVEVPSHLPVTTASPYPPRPRASLIKRAVAYIRERKTKKEAKELDPDATRGKKQRELFTHPNQQLEYPSEHSLSSIYELSDLPLSPANPLSPTPPTGTLGSGLSTDTSGGPSPQPATNHALDLTGSASKQDALDDDNIDLSLLTLEAVQAFLSGYCDPTPIPTPVVVKSPKHICFAGSGSNLTTDVRVNTLPARGVAESPARSSKGARLLNRLNIWIEAAHASHVGEPTLDERPRAGSDFEMKWATILEE